jgi:hypothetical protein
MSQILPSFLYLSVNNNFNALGLNDTTSAVTTITTTTNTIASATTKTSTIDITTITNDQLPLPRSQLTSGSESISNMSLIPTRPIYFAQQYNIVWNGNTRVYPEVSGLEPAARTANGTHLCH